MNEVKVGQTYFEILNSLKDQIANNLAISCKEANLTNEQTRKIIFSAQSAIDTVGGNALSALIKSCK